MKALALCRGFFFFLMIFNCTMKHFFILLNFLFFIQLNAQNSIVHAIDIDPDSKELKEKIEISTSSEYLFKLPKDLLIKGRTVTISPQNYKVIEGNKYDLLLFNAPKIEVIYSERIPENNFKVSDKGVNTVSVDFSYNYLSKSGSIDYDSTTNNTISSFIQIAGEYEIVSYRFNPDIGVRNLDGNKIQLKGNVNRMHVEIDYIRRKGGIFQPKKEIIVQKEIAFKGTVTLSVWDDVQEDGDVISLWLGDICLAKNLKVSKEKVNYQITKEMFGASSTLNIRIDNVDEGTVPPNTVLVELRGGGINENMRINTTNAISKEIVLKK